MHVCSVCVHTYVCMYAYMCVLCMSIVPCIELYPLEQQFGAYLIFLSILVLMESTPMLSNMGGIHVGLIFSSF